MNVFFKLQTFLLVVIGKSQVLLITLTNQHAQQDHESESA